MAKSASITPSVQNLATQTSIEVVGLGIHQPPLLSPSVMQILQTAKVVFGSARQLTSVSQWLSPQAKQHTLPSLDLLPQQLTQQLKQFDQVVVLASGDPLFYGIGKFLRKQLGEQVRCYTNTSSLQAACQATGVSLQDTQVVSLHGRPLHTLHRYLQAGRCLMVLPDKHSQPQHLAAACQSAGLSQTRIHVCERMGYDDEQIHAYTVADLLAKGPQAKQAFNPLHVSVLALAGEGVDYADTRGIADHHFVTNAQAGKAQVGKGLLTKREVRVNVLACLPTAIGDVCWDIGAGCGGVAVEWALWHPHSRIYAIEDNPERMACLQANRQKFGVLDNLRIIEGRAPAVCQDLPQPQRIFIGGSGGDLPAILTQAWALLAPGGRLLVSAVTEGNKNILMNFSHTLPVDKSEFMQIAISKQDYLAGIEMLRPQLPVTLIGWDKPYDH